MAACKGAEDIIGKERLQGIPIPVSGRIDCLDEPAALQEFIEQEDIPQRNHQCWTYRVPGLPFHGRFLVFGRDAAESVGLDVIFKNAVFPVFEDAMFLVDHPAKI